MSLAFCPLTAEAGDFFQNGCNKTTCFFVLYTRKKKERVPMQRSHINNLLLQIADGDQQAFERLYLETRKGVFAFLYTYLQNYHDSEDAMQDVYLKIKQNIDRYQPGTNGSAWILQIAKNHALNILSYQNRHRTTDIDELAGVAGQSGIESVGGVTDVMQRVLSEQEQRIVTMHVLWGYKHREIAEELDCPVGTVTSKYKRAIEKLKAEMRDW